MEEQKPKSAESVEQAQSSISIVQGSVSADSAVIHGDAQIGNRININVDPSTQERADHFLRAEQNLKQEEKEAGVVREKQALAKTFLGRVIK